MPVCARVVRVFAAVAVLVPVSVVGLGVPAVAAPVGRSGVSARAAHRPVPLSMEQALARAKVVGRPVAVTGATTPTDTLAANPDGSLTVRHSLVPVRVRAGRGWRSLDAALRRNGDGSWSPAAAPGGLRLSGGGSGPLAVLSSAGRSLAVSWPSRLPVPVISGAAATYAGVLPGVDVRVTASTLGGFSEVLVVHSAAAAADPALHRLVLAARAPGLTLAVGKAGDITAATPGGVAVFSAPAPWMWDSARAAGVRTVLDPVTGQRVDARSGQPVASSAASPGAGAHVAAVGVGVRPGAIVLRPDARMLVSGSTVFPVYIDPTFTAPSAGASRNAWTQVDSGFSTTSYWKESSELQVGKCYVTSPDYCNGLGVARSFVQFAVPTSIYGATVLSAQLNMTEVWSPSCTAKPVEAWHTGGISSSTTWGAQPTWASRNDTQTVAHGHDSACPAAGVGFNIASAMTSAAAGHWPSVTFGIKAGDESDQLGWKKFSNTAAISVTYDHPPSTPTGLITSPVTSCAAATPTVVGDGNVSLYVPVFDPDGGTLGVQLQLWNTATGAAFTGTPTDPQQLYKPSGSTAVFIAHQADLEKAANGAITEFSWKARVTDFRKDSNNNYIYGPWSATCNFKFDPTRPGAPTVTLSGSAQIGQPVTLAISPPSGSTLPTSYIYQLNGGVPDTETANPTNGSATITVVPTRFTNTLTVTSQSLGGNIGDTANKVFNATPAATAGDSDMTGDGIPDLLTPGATNGLPAGLWLAAGKGNGQVQAGASDLGANGNGTAGDNSPADFTGAQAMTGHFGGTGLQDVLTYYPHDGRGAVAGQANILAGSGDGSPIQAQRNDVEQTIPAGIFADLYGDNPIQLANGGNTSGNGYAYPDLIGISGDTGSGYYLNLYPNMDGAGNYPVPYPLLDNAGGPLRTPAGGSDWNQWVIATAQLPSGTAMYLWNPATGELYLWDNLTAVYDPNADSYTLSYTQYLIADGATPTTTWNKGAALTLRAADVNRDGAPDLWAVGGGGVVTAYLATLGTTTATLTAQPAQGLTAPTHAWALNDGTGGSVTNAADSAGSLDATGGGNATWNTGDLFDPDVRLDGSSGTALATTGPAIDPARDFTVSAWVKPAALGGTVLSQDMTSAASFRIYADTASQTWKFCMTTADASTASYNCAGGGKVTVGAWVHLTGTYQASHGVMNLYLGDIHVGGATHTAVTGTSGGGFQIGDYRTGGSHAGYFSGQVAGVQTFNQVTLPAQDATPDGYYQPITPARLLDTRYGTGGTTGPVAAGGTVRLKIAGVGSIPVSNVTAAVVNVTAVNESSSGFLNVYPDGTPTPYTSNLNYQGSTPIANLLITPVSPDGYIDLLNVSSGTTQLIADVSGYFTSDPAAPGDTTYTPMPAPKRILDTRSGLGAPKAKISGGATLALQIGGANGIPAGVSAVAINMTAVNETAGGYLIQYADGTSKPPVSNLQFQTAAIAGMAIVPVGTDGKIDSYVSSTGSTDLVADVSGYFLPGTGGEVYHPIGATRLFDTRQEGQPLASGGTRPVSQSSVIAADPVLVLNVTAVTNSTSTGDLDVYPAGISPPGTSNVNYHPGANFANLALAATAGGVADIHNSSNSGTVDVLADCFGYFSPH
jgi:hypothetical protein